MSTGHYRQLQVTHELSDRMDLVGVVYMSRSTHPTVPLDLDRLLMDSRSFNSQRGVTGVLLFGGNQFIQYIEGLPTDIEHVYGRIRRSALHSDLVELEKRRIPQRLFRHWFMGFRDAPRSVIQQLSQEQWTREAPRAEDHSAASSGMRQLMRFLDSVSTDER